MTKQPLFIEFNTLADSLNDKEHQVLKLLIEAGKLLAKVYEAQLNGHDKPQFYPKDATSAEIEKAAVKDPEILSPYTVVERDKNGKLIAVPYHIKYREQLTAVSKKIEEAVKLCADPDFKKLLETQAKVLLSGQYREVKVIDLKMKPYVLNMVFGPIERIEDDLFFVKRSYQSWLGILNHSLTGRANSFKDAIFATNKRFYSSTEKLDFMDKAQIRVDNTVLFSGMVSRYKFTGETLPNDNDIIERYGTRSTIFLPMARELFTKHYQIYESIFSENFRQSFTKEDLSRAYLYTVMLHEIARVLVRYRLASQRLKELYPIFNEMTLEAMAIKICGTLLIKDMISQKEMEAILVMFLTRIFDYYLEMKDNPASKIYVLGNAVLLNSLIDQGALKIAKDGLSWPNFTKMFISVSNVADEVEKVLAEGTYKDAQRYIEQHSSLTAFKQFKLKF